jgi:hypothetical protein
MSVCDRVTISIHYASVSGSVELLEFGSLVGSGRLMEKFAGISRATSGIAGGNTTKRCDEG